MRLINPLEEKLKTNRDRSKINLSLEEDDILDEKKSLHLLRRLSFNPSQEEVNRINGRPVGEVVDELLGDGLDYLPQNSDRLVNGRSSLNWIDTVEEDPLRVHPQIRGSIEGIHKNRYRQLVDWWLDIMRNDVLSESKSTATERLTFFWHTHWTIEFTYDTRSYIPPPILYRNNEKIRKYRLGNFKDFVLEMTLDGAYLLYQGLQDSSKGSPNENFARELMELFTMGIGNYSEGDIREASRALTGWRVSAHRQDPKPYDFFDTYFRPQDHDLESKQIMGETIPARPEEDNTIDKVRNEEVFGLIEILFERRPEPIARFIANKVYTHFVYSNPSETDQTVINELAQTFMDNDFELLPMFKQLFKSQHFFDELNRGVQIKQPIELIIGTEKLLRAKYSQQYNATIDLEQLLYDPPNVGGWDGYRGWISTKTYPRRIKHLNQFVDQIDNDKWLEVVESFNDYYSFELFMYRFLGFCLPVDVNEDRLLAIISLANSDTNVNAGNWNKYLNTNRNEIAKFMANLMKVIVKLPDYQLT